MVFLQPTLMCSCSSHIMASEEVTSDLATIGIDPLDLNPLPLNPPLGLNLPLPWDINMLGVALQNQSMAVTPPVSPKKKSRVRSRVSSPARVEKVAKVKTPAKKSSTKLQGKEAEKEAEDELKAAMICQTCQNYLKMSGPSRCCSSCKISICDNCYIQMAMKTDGRCGWCRQTDAFTEW